VVALAVAAGFAFRESLRRLGGQMTATLSETATVRREKPTSAIPIPGGGPFPRRALAICVNNYLYLNPVSYGEPDHDVHSLMERLAQVLHVPPTQIGELSDARPGKATLTTEKIRSGRARKATGTAAPLPIPSPTPPLKPVIEKTITDFLATSQPQDRILLLFMGHAVEISDQGYLVPLEGELAVKESLIPLSWLYDRLKECKARQKVLVLDTCRLDPGRGLERPGSGPMGAKLDAQLAKPPEGVQVWSACTAGQYSYEVNGSSLFSDEFQKALSQQVIKRIQEPDAPLPLTALTEAVAKGTANQALEQWKAKETPRLAGGEPDESKPVERTEEPLPQVAIAPIPPPVGGTASPADVRAILDEIALPPIKLTSELTTPLHIEALVPFSAKKLEPYRADYRSLSAIEDNPDKYPLRAVVLQAVRVINKEFNPHNDAFALRDSFPGGNSEAVKAQIAERQTKPALIHEKLTEALENLKKVGEERDKEPSKRWQCHYDYIYAALLARIAYVYEYDLMLGKIRKDELPMPEKGMPLGWRLASQEKLSSGKEIRDMVAESRKLLAKLAKKNPGTPWEVLAKREQLTALGLKWELIR
jgi:hypothetical protein